MKLKRQKAVKRTLQFYGQHFGYKAPFSILADGTFCRAALSARVNLNEQLPRYLQAETMLCTTACVLSECEALGSRGFGPLSLLRDYKQIACSCNRGQQKGSLLPSADKCIRRIASQLSASNSQPDANHVSEGQKHVIATQDRELTEFIHEHCPGVPLLYLNGNCLVLEKPTQSTRQIALDSLRTSAPEPLIPSAASTLKLEPSTAPDHLSLQLAVPQSRLVSAHERDALRASYRRELGVDPIDDKPKITGKRHRVKGPNPLSCKPKKRKVHAPKASSKGVATMQSFSDIA